MSRAIPFNDLHKHLYEYMFSTGLQRAVTERFVQPACTYQLWSGEYMGKKYKRIAGELVIITEHHQQIINCK